MINMAAASLLSTNALDYCVILFVKKPFYTGIFSPLGLELLNRNCDEIYAERRKQLSNRNGLRAWSCFLTFPGCLYTAISNLTLGGYTFKTSPSSSLLISDNFIIRKSWYFFKGVLKILRFSLITLTFFLNYRSVGVVSSLAQRFFHRSAPTSTKRASSNS